MTNLEKYLYQLRRIEEHREKKAEKEIRKIYKELLKELNGFLGNIYATYSEDDMLNYADLAKAGMDARFLEEVEQRINSISPKVSKEIQETVQQTYEACYDGMRNAVVKAAGNRELLQQAFATVQACTPEVIRAAVNNPVSGLTLKDTLEKHRKEIIYDIKKNIGVGLTNGDRFSTMAGRISESLDGDYKKAVRIVRTEAHRVRETGFNDAATAIDDTLKKGTSGYVMAKTWKTMQDERVRPLKQKRKKYNHVKMDGVTIPQNELFKLPSGATCKAPSQTGVAGEDINCRCYLSYDLVLASELTKVQDGKKTIEEAAKQQTPPVEVPKIKNVLSKEDYEEYMRLINNNENEGIKALYAKHANNINSLKRERGRGYYIGRNITFDLETAEHIAEGKGKFSILAHEYGHFFDNLTYKDIHFNEIDTIKKNVKWSNLNKVASSSDEFLAAVRLDKDYITSIYGQLKTELKTAASHGVQDAVDGMVMGGSMRLNWGHGERYYNRKYNYFKEMGSEKALQNVYKGLGLDASNQTKVKSICRNYETASEMWANIACAIIGGGKELEITKKYLPNAYKAFLEIIGKVE